MSTTLNFPIWATGRRKTSVARVRIIQGSGQILINDKSVNDYFSGHVRAKSEATSPLQAARSSAGFDFHITVSGGGVSGQAGAVKLGIARGLVEIDPSQKSAFRKGGFLTRDPRMVERKKPGQPKARRRFQHSKR